MPFMQVRFIDDPADSNNGKIQVTMTGGKATSTYKLGVVGPDGESVKAFPVSNDGTGLLLTQYVDIPTINTGTYLYGEYIFQAFIGDTLAGPDFNESKTYNWCPNTDKSLDINVIVDCFSKNLVIQDLTSYPTGTLTRLITVDVPNVYNTDVVADQTTSDDELALSLIRSDGVAYYNVTYGLLVTASNVVSDTTDSDWTLEYQQGYTSYAQDILIECGQDVCSVISCVDTKVQELLDAACASGGIRNMSKQDADLLQEIQVSLAMYTYWLKCSNHTKTVYYYNRLKELTGNPSCLTVSGPTAIPDSTITYLRGRSAYEVWLDAGNSGDVEDFLDALYPVGSWVNVESSDFDADYSSDSSNPLRYRILKAHLEMLGEFVHGASEASGFKLLETTFDPADLETEAAFPIFNRTAGGIQVGQLYKDGDGAWKVRYSEDYDSAQDQYVHGLIPLIGTASNTVSQDTLTYPTLSAWTQFPSGDYVNGYSPVTGNELSYRTDGRFMYFKGRFDATGNVSTGFNMFDASFFTGLGITLLDGSAAPVFEGGSNGDQARAVGYVQVVSGTLRMFSSPDATDEGDQLIIAGKITLE